MFAIEHSRVEPDIVAMAKGIASGMRSVCVGARRVMTWRPAHMRARSAAIPSRVRRRCHDTAFEETLMANAATVGEHLLATLKELADRHPLIGTCAAAV